MKLLIIVLSILILFSIGWLTIVLSSQSKVCQKTLCLRPSGAGRPTSKSKLNSTLTYIVNLLQKHKIKNWFIGYGTLLGIVRGNSCIDKDDDIDIIMDETHHEVLLKILKENNFDLSHSSKRIVKTIENPNFASIDFYMATIDKEGNFFDTWERIKWSRCLNVQGKLNERLWNGVTLHLPNDCEAKLQHCYGKDWRTPKKGKGYTGNRVL